MTSVVFIAAEAPVKNIRMFINNIKICNTVCDSLEKKKIKHLIYISSDAVYADVKEKISEKIVTSPSLSSWINAFNQGNDFKI